MNKFTKYFLLFFVITICYGFLIGAVWTIPNASLSTKLFGTSMITMIAYGIPVSIITLND